MPTSHYDLHCHSTRSDGVLTPGAVVTRAAERGVRALALTDHDEVSGLAEARAQAADSGIELINGVEISVTWRERTVHVVGLHVDPGSEVLLERLNENRAGRNGRAARMAAQLESAGIPGALEGARAYVTNPALVSRTHFARFLIEAGYAKDGKDVFARYLTPGKPGHVSHEWATLSQAIGWIHAAGGQAVLAHPGRYRVTPTGMRHLLSEFRDSGGDAIEILSPSHTPAQYQEFATHARVLGLRGSCGSDWHGPGEGWMDLGDLPDFPASVVPVWKDW